MTTLRLAPSQTRLQVLGEKTGTANRGVTVPDFPKENKHQPGSFKTLRAWLKTGFPVS